MVVFLVGFMGAGKSTVGRALAKAMGWQFEDLDDRIERRERQTVAEIFRNSGESGFRRAEHAALQEILLESRAPGGRVIALGGGAFAQQKNVRLLAAAEALTVFLDASKAELWRRCCEQAAEQKINRPLMSNMDDFCKLYQQRQPHYSKASLTQSTDNKSVAQVVKEIMKSLALTKNLPGESSQQ